MIELILNSLRGGQAAPVSEGSGFEASQIAAAALLVEASRADADFDVNERATIRTLIERQFSLSPSQANALLMVASEQQLEGYSNWMFTRAVRDGFSAEERLEILRMLWSVAYADGSLHRFEKHLIAQVAERLEIDSRSREAARRAALDALGMDDPTSGQA